jgi:hypothetical protein
MWEVSSSSMCRPVSGPLSQRFSPADLARIQSAKDRTRDLLRRIGSRLDCRAGRCCQVVAGSLAGVAFPGDDRCDCFVVLHPAHSACGPSAHGGGLQTPESGWTLPVAYRSHLGGARLLELPLDDDGVGLSPTSLAALIRFLRTDCSPP